MTPLLLGNGVAGSRHGDVCSDEDDDRDVALRSSSRAFWITSYCATSPARSMLGSKVTALRLPR